MISRKTVAEFFAGIGLMRMGLEAAGWETLFANDIDPVKRAMYCTHFGDDGTFSLGDVHRLSIGEVPSTVLATASFPCNDLSLAGGRAGLAGAQSSAFWGFIRVLEESGERRPRIVLLENVVGFLSSNGGADFHSALTALNELGYGVDAFLIDAARFVPQSRVRLFVVGSRLNCRSGSVRPGEGADSIFLKDGRKRAIPEPQSLPVPEHACRPSALAEFIRSHPEIDWRIRELPPLPTRTLTLHELIEDIPANSPLWWNAERAAYLLSQMSPRHRVIADSMIDGATVTHGTVFRRVRVGRSMAELRTDGVAGCLRTPRGGSGRQILFAAGLGRFAVRLLTPRECARLMGADDFVIRSSPNRALFGFGDAVCVPVIQWIGGNYLNPLFADLAVAARPASGKRASTKSRRASLADGTSVLRSA